MPVSVQDIKKPKFDPSAKFEPVDSGKPAFNPNGKFEAVDESAAAPEVPKAQPADDISSYPGFGSRAFELPGDAAAAADKQKVVEKSQGDVMKAFRESRITDELNRMQKQAFENTQNQIPHYQNTMHNAPEASDADINENSKTTQEVVNPLSGTGRTIMQNAKKNSGNPESFKDLDAAMYANDRGASYNPEVYANIKNNTLGYDYNKKRPTKKFGGGEEYISGLKEHSENADKADFLATASPEEIIKKEEERRNSFNPDEPIPETSGWASAMHTAGQNTVPILSGIIPAVGVGAAEYLSGGAATPLLGSIIGGGLTARDGKQMLASTFEGRYDELRDQHPEMSPMDVYHRAMSDAKASSVNAAAQMAALTFIGLKGGGQTLKGVDYSTLKTAMNGLGRNIVASTKTLPKEIGIQAPLAAASKAFDNWKQDKPIGKDVGAAALSTAEFLSVIHTAASLPGVFKPEVRERIVSAISKLSPEATDPLVNQLVTQKNLTPDQASEFKQELDKQRSLNNGLTSDVPLENRQKIQNLVDKRTELENQLDPQHPSFVDKAYHPDIKEQINSVKKVNTDGTTEGKDGINEKIRQLSQPMNKEEPPSEYEDLIKKPDVTSGLSDIMKKDYEANPDQFLKEVADHAHGGAMFEGKFVSSRPGAEKEYGPELVKLATEKYPEHILSPKTETNGQETEAHAETQGQIENQDAGQQTASSEKPHVTVSTPNIVNVKLKNQESAPSRIKDYSSPEDIKGYKPDSIMHFNQGIDNNRVTLIVDPEVKSEYSKKLAQWKKISGGSGSGMKHVLRDVAKEFRDKNGNDKIIDLRGIDLSKPSGDIINQLKEKQNAIPEQSAGAPEKITNENKNEGEGKRVGGIAQRVQEKINLSPYEKGKGWSKEEALKFGQTAIQFGIDPERVLTDKDYAGKEGMDDLDSKLAVAQAHSIDLTKEMHDAGDRFGTDSNQFKEAQGKLAAYQKLVQPAKTASSKAFTAQQGEYDVDLNSFTSVGSKVKSITGKEPNAVQTKQIKELTQKNKELTQKLSDTDAKLIESTNKALGEKEGKLSIAQSGKAIADKIRKNAKLSRPGTFSAATPASLVWDSAVEVVAQAVEKGALLADAISQGINHIKNTDWYKGLSDDKKLDAMNDFSDWHHNQATDSIASKFIDKEGNKFTNDEAKEIWEYAKDNYLSKGTSFRDMIENVSNDTGLSFEQASSAITTPKTKGLSDARWKQQYELRRNQKATERYIDKQGESRAVRAFKSVVNAIREESVFGHGGVFVGTHAGMTLTDLPRARLTIKAFLNANKFAYGKLANYEKSMENLKNKKNYLIAQRATLQNNPDFINNDAEVISSKFGKFSEAGKRGFNAIKVLRQELFDIHYDALSDVEKQDPGAAVAIARLVNNATGATNLKLPDWFKQVSFAGGMEAARWGKLTRNPLEATSIAVKILFNPKNVPIADRVFAKVWAKRVGAQLGTYAGLIAANAAVQSYMNNGKNPVNFTDPTKSDWMKMKIGNTTFDFTSGMLSTLHFAEETLYHQPFGAQKSKDDVVTREGKTAFKYGLGKLSPAYADAGEVILQHDYSGNTLPWSNAKPLHNYNHKMTYPEYVSGKLPLPVAEGFNAYFEAANQKSNDKTFVDKVLTGLKDGAVSGTTGFRAYDTPEKKDKKESNQYAPKLNDNGSGSNFAPKQFK